MATQQRLIKIGRQGILVRTLRVPASFFRHRQPGKPFVVLATGERRLMHVRAGDLESIGRAYRAYVRARETPDGSGEAGNVPRRRTA